MLHLWRARKDLRRSGLDFLIRIFGSPYRMIFSVPPSHALTTNFFGPSGVRRGLLHFILDLSTFAIAILPMRTKCEHMTRLGAIRNNHLSIRCWCGHAGLIPVKAFIEKFGPDITADQAVTKTRCTKCGASVRAGSQIVYVGNSEFAMSGSRTAQDSE